MRSTKRIHVVIGTVAVGLAAVGLAVAASQRNVTTHLTGELEVPANSSAGQGQAIFKVAQDGSSISYKLNVANIENVFMAHIHQGLPGANGQIMVWLFPSTAPVMGPQGGGRIQGRIADGTITAANLVNTAVTGVDTIEELVELLVNGGAYVNVHTSDGNAANGTANGPGDLFAGEIRGNL